MKTIAFLNIKGGVGKTTSTLAFAMLLHEEYGQRVLVLDCDKQANSTKSLGCYGAPYTTASLLTEKENVVEAAVQHSPFGIDIIGANWDLMKANQDVLLDVTRPQQYRIKKQLEPIRQNYDYCLIDCPPDINMATINALAISDDVLIPIRVDKYGFDGLEYVTQAVQEMQDFNPALYLRGCFLTQYQPNTNLSVSGFQLLQNELGLHGMNTAIRMTVKVGESTFYEPLLSYAPHCTATEDYRLLLNEYLEGGNIHG